MTMWRHARTWIGLAGTLFGFWVATVQAQDSESAATTAPVELTAADLESFVESLMAEQIDKNKVAGAVIAVVKDGAILFAKGYGHADVAAKTPMTPDATLVRPGSISKLFTAVAVMQLVEQGKLELDRDVNDYIDFAIPAPEGGVPVTLRRLMTHRAGFAEQYKELITFQAQPKSLGDWLKAHRPPRLYPKGDVSSYSNYGVALAGYIVERASGATFADYVAAHIFTPLGMTRATMAVPPPSALLPMVSQAYWSSDRPPLPGYEMVPALGAGSLAATAEDMTRFMRALLGGGEWEGQRILKTETLTEMLSPQVKHPAGEMGLQFVKFQFGGRDYIGHTGGTIAVYSNFIFLPEENFGLFVSFNSAASGRALIEMPRQIAERYFPRPLPPPAPLAEADRMAAKVAGVYQISQRLDSNFMKVLAMAGQVGITALPDGTLTMGSALGLGPEQPPYIEVAPGAFRRPNGSMIAFAPNTDHGGLTLQVSPPALEFHRVPWHQNGRLIVPVVALSFLIALFTLLGWPVMAYRRRRRGATFGAEAIDRKAFILVRAVAALDVFVLGTLMVVGAWIGGDVSKLDGRLDPAFAAIYAGAWLGALGAPAAAIMAYNLIQNRVGSRWSRVHHALLGLAALVLGWFFVAYNIAGTTLRY
jgi:CubicO group peptidase (beta-lactamase class C family)